MDITKESNGDSKTERNIRDDSSDKCKGSVYVEEVADNKPGDGLIVSEQVSNKIICNSSNNIAFLVTVFSGHKY